MTLELYAAIATFVVVGLGVFTLVGIKAGIFSR